MDEIDRHLLSLFSKKIALASRPYAMMGEIVGTDEADVLLRINHLKELGHIGPLRCFFDSAKLGYRSILIAMRIAPETIEAAAEVTRGHPGLRSSLLRNHIFNLWLSLQLPVDEVFENHIQKLHDLTHSQTTFALPILKAYKSSVDPFEGVRRRNEAVFIARASGTPRKIPTISELEKKCIYKMQEEFPLTDHPIRKMAAALAMTEDELFQILRKLEREGCFLGIYAILKKEAPLINGTLVVWNVPEEIRDQIGSLLALFGTITSCYERPAYAEFPYSLYTMVDVKDEALVEEVIQGIASKIGNWPYLSLCRQKVFKDEKLRLFAPELKDWCRRFGLPAEREHDMGNRDTQKWHPIMGSQSFVGGVN